MKNLIAGLMLASAVLGAAVTSAAAQDPTIVLVHGAFADGSSWRKVIPLLRARGKTSWQVTGHVHPRRLQAANRISPLSRSAEPPPWNGLQITAQGRPSRRDFPVSWL